MTRQEYFARPEISRTLLFELSKDQKAAKRMMEGDFSKENKALKIGDAIDVLMFDGEDAYREKFFVMTYENPFPNVTNNDGKFMKEMVSLVSQYPLTPYIDIYQYAYDNTGMKRPSFDDMVSIFVANGGEEYLDQIRDSSDKIVLDVNENALILNMRDALLISPFSYLFGGERSDDNVSVFYQVVIVWEGKKSMLDIIYIDHQKKKIYGIDLKSTSEHPNRIESSFLSYGYDIQAGMYHDALKDWAAKNYLEYTVEESFDFIFVTKESEPSVFGISVEGDDLIKCKEGGVTRSGYTRKGYKRLEEELKYHIENNVWNLPYDFLIGDYQKKSRLFQV